MKQVLEHFGDIRDILGSNEEFSRGKLLTVLSDSQKILLQLELAVVVDFAQHFVKASYQLKGSGLLAFKAFTPSRNLLLQLNRLIILTWIVYLGNYVQVIWYPLAC